MRGAAAVLALAVLAALFVADHDAWTPDEPRVVGLAQSVARGSWVVPRLDGEPFLEQPPLHAWSVAVAFRAFGETVTVARSVSVAWSLLTLLVTFLLGERLAGRRAGTLAALLLGTSAGFFWCQHRVIADPALAFFVVGSAYASLRGLTGETPRERTGGLLLAYAGASLAYLAKGVVGVGLSGFAFLAVVIALRDARRLLRAHLWLAPLCFAVVTGPYHWRLHEECGLEGLRVVVVDNTLVRATTGLQHAQGPWYYLGTFPLLFLPTTLFFLGGAAWFARARAALDARTRLAWEVPLAWFALSFLALSIARSKREVYLLPILPAAALMSALWLERVLDGEDRSPFASYLPRALGLILVLIGIALPVGACAVIGVPWLVPCTGAALAIAAGVGSQAFAATDRPGRALALILAGGLALVAAADRALVPYVDARKALGPALVEAVAFVPSDRALYVLVPDETALGAVPFYTGRSVAALPAVRRDADALAEARRELVAHLHGERELWVLAIEKRDSVVFDSVKSLGPELVKVWAPSRADRLKGREVRLLRFRAR